MASAELQKYVAKPGTRGLALVLVEENYEDTELWYPKFRLGRGCCFCARLSITAHRLEEAGFDVQVRIC